MRTYLPLFRALADISRSSPIVQMAGRARREGELTERAIRELSHPAGIRYVDITPALLMTGALAIAARFIALGLNNTDLYILAGISCGFFVGLRYLIYRLMRRGDEG